MDPNSNNQNTLQPNGFVPPAAPFPSIQSQSPQQPQPQQQPQFQSPINPYQSYSAPTAEVASPPQPSILPQPVVPTPFTNYPVNPIDTIQNASSVQNNSVVNELPSFSFSSTDTLPAEDAPQQPVIFSEQRKPNFVPIVTVAFLIIFLLIGAALVMLYLKPDFNKIITGFLTSFNSKDSSKNSVMIPIDQDQPYFTLNPNEKSAGFKKGERFKILVKSGSAKRDLLGYDLVLFYDNNLLTLEKKDIKSGLDTIMVFTQLDEELGEVVITGSKDVVGEKAPLILKEDSILEISFTLKDTALSNESIKLLREGQAGEQTKMMFASTGDYPDKVAPQLGSIDLSSLQKTTSE